MSLPAIAEHFVCPINQDIMDDPVRIKCQGRHAFNRDGIAEWFKNHNTCPVCKQQVVSKKLTSDRLLKQIIETWKQEQSGSPASLAGRTEAKVVSGESPKPVKKEEGKEAARYSYDSRSSRQDYSSRVSSFRPALPQRPPAAERTYHVQPVYTPSVHIYFSCHGCVQPPQSNPYQPELDRMNATLARIETQVGKIKGAVDRYVSRGDRRY